MWIYIKFTFSCKFTVKNKNTINFNLILNVTYCKIHSFIPHPNLNSCQFHCAKSTNFQRTSSIFSQTTIYVILTLPSMLNKKKKKRKSYSSSTRKTEVILFWLAPSFEASSLPIDAKFKVKGEKKNFFSPPPSLLCRVRIFLLPTNFGRSPRTQKFCPSRVRAELFLYFFGAVERYVPFCALDRTHYTTHTS